MWWAESAGGSKQLAMRLVTLKAYRSLIYAPGSEPSLVTLRTNLDKIPGGCRVRGRCYIDLDVHDRITKARCELEERRQRLLKSPVLRGLL